MKNMKFPYLTKRSGSRKWYLKIPIPDDLHEEFGKWDKWKSLRTEDRKEAERLYFSHPFIAEWKEKFEDAFLGRPTGSQYGKLRSERLKRFRSAQRDIHKYAAATDAWIDPAFAEEYPDAHNEKQIVSETENALARKKIAQLEQDKSVGTIDAATANEKIEALQHIINGIVPTGEPKSSKLPKMRVIADEFLKEIERKLKGPTFCKRQTQIAYAIEIMKNRPIDGYTLEHGRKLKAALLIKPGQKKGTVIGPDTINQYLKVTSRLFKWAQTHYSGAIINPVKGFHVPLVTPDVEDRPKLPFTPDELTVLFGALKNDNPLYWPCLVALYSGIRSGATVQLHFNDIKTDNGVVYFDIHRANENRLKPGPSKRQVPVHKTLIKLGFLEFVKTRKDDYLFPLFGKATWKHKEGERGYASNDADRWQSNLSTRFSSFLKIIKIKHDQISWQSFRHTFVDGCRNADISFTMSLWLQGRSEPGSMGGYGQGHKLENKKKAVNKIKFDFDMPPVKPRCRRS